MKIEINLKPKGVIAVLVLWALLLAALLCLVFAPMLLVGLVCGGFLLFILIGFSLSIYEAFADE